MDPARLEGLPRLAFDVALALVRPLFAFNQYESFLYWPFLTVTLTVAVLIFLLHRHDADRSFIRRYFSHRIWGHISAKADYKFYYINGVLFPAIFTPLILSGAWVGKAVQSGLIDLWGVGTAHGGGLCTSGLYTLIFFFWPMISDVTWLISSSTALTPCGIFTKCIIRPRS